MVFVWKQKGSVKNIKTMTAGPTGFLSPTFVPEDNLHLSERFIQPLLDVQSSGVSLAHVSKRNDGRSAVSGEITGI